MSQEKASVGTTRNKIFHFENMWGAMNILEEIIAFKKIEVGQRKLSRKISELENTMFFNRKPLSLAASLSAGSQSGIIAEFKRRSPSKGIINDHADAGEVTKGYTDHGAAALSVLTDKNFFGGDEQDLLAARVNEIPILRKDFIIDEYQLLEARSMGADVILLIAACLSPSEVRRLAIYAKNLGLEVLLELHNESELEHICDETLLIGINNRDLKTFTVDAERSVAMARKIPGDRIKIAESGIKSPDDVKLFKENGFQGFLIGELFMKEPDPAIALAGFVNAIQHLTKG